ncbi:hypothetical protein GDO86_007221 [Hymenochirus boettgeri]|uniref:Uncharacterized protein n=1 Tax=Hymenochirus boettgeri TaxID=247094 RepID=A0A8T2J0Y1_9PIPI|nr:hypothetical protein GDO86_007221 [Hymenochirus boettgeri]
MRCLMQPPLTHPPTPIGGVPIVICCNFFHMLYGTSILCIIQYGAYLQSHSVANVKYCLVFYTQGVPFFNSAPLEIGPNVYLQTALCGWYYAIYYINIARLITLKQANYEIMQCIILYTL